MNTNKQFLHHFSVKASLESVAAFHQDTRALKQLTPPPMFITFNELGTHYGKTFADFNIWMGPIPVRWVALISAEEDTPGFVDTQVKGPFDFWEHRHTFIPVDDNETKIVDQITARPSKHPFWGLISRFFWLTLPILFAYRKWRTRRELEHDIQ